MYITGDELGCFQNVTADKYRLNTCHRHLQEHRLSQIGWTCPQRQWNDTVAHTAWNHLWWSDSLRLTDA